jgi:UDP-N-acetylglucosamine-lysosomal-enzyme
MPGMGVHRKWFGDFRLEDNRVVHALLVDFLESVFPVPSSFELPPDFRNKFSHTFQLEQWKLYRWRVCVAAFWRD